MATANSFIDYCICYLGVKEGDSNHKQIIDTYNSISPLPRGYHVKYTDPWCAAFISAMAKMSNALDQIPAECGAERLRIKLSKKASQVDIRNAQVGDIVFYDFGYDLQADHVGAIYRVNDDTIEVIEGNKSDAVGYRILKKKDASEILTILRPKWDTNPTAVKSDGTLKNINEIVKEVIQGKWGNGTTRRQKLAAAGYDYNTIQSLVNQKLNK